jgi:hypothetical protein
MVGIYLITEYHHLIVGDGIFTCNYLCVEPKYCQKVNPLPRERADPYTWCDSSDVAHTHV